MSTAADINAKPADEFVVYSEPLPKDKTSDKSESSLALDTFIPPVSEANRTDSFPRTLPLPASSVLSPTSAPTEQELLPSINTQEIQPAIATSEDVVSPPETETAASKMYVQTANIAAPSAEFDARATTPLAELAGTDFDQAVAQRRRGASLVGEEISEGLDSLNVQDEEPASGQEKKTPVFTDEMIQARKADPAVLAAVSYLPKYSYTFPYRIETNTYLIA